ncbi:MAG: type secretion system permease/ATPase [Proteobacteria bacterium]|nr:type secretion system permease/ATPase [Pseudomonadota bacterium]
MMRQADIFTRTGGQSSPVSIQQAKTAVRGAFVGVILLSAVLNIFMLSGSLFMLQVYDRVMPSGSIPTLIVLCGLMVFVYAALGLIEALRTRLLVRISERFDEIMAGVTLGLSLRLPLISRGVNAGGEPSRPMQDFERVRAFIGSLGPAAFADLPWVPLYLAVAYLFHPYLGHLALAGVVILVLLTLLSEWRSRGPAQNLAKVAGHRAVLVEAGIRNAETLAALGMRPAFLERFESVNRERRTTGFKGADVSSFFSALTKTIRLILQSGSLALGAWLALSNEISSGTIIAASIITSRSMAPIEQVIAQWRSFVGARQSWERLKSVLGHLETEIPRSELPRPEKSLSIRGLAVPPPGGKSALVRDVAFTVTAGEAVGVIGPSGAGKSSLARALVGAWMPANGEIRLDGAEIGQWSSDVIGRYIGYLPQGVELLDGTVAENIARLSTAPDFAAVLEAAKLARAHDTILKLPQGYDTRVGLGGVTLSAGQRQRVGLARAVYGNPFLVVLDEPNANLDAEGDEGLAQAVADLKARGSIIIVIAHRPSAITHCDHVLVISEGRQTGFGPKEEILKRATVSPVRQVAAQ